MAKGNEVVREKGLEPLPRKPGLGPQPSASANSATRARWVRSEYRIAPHPCQADEWVQYVRYTWMPNWSARNSTGVRIPRA